MTRHFPRGRMRWFFGALIVGGFAAGTQVNAAEQAYCEYDYCDTFMFDECKHNSDLAANCAEGGGGGCSHSAC